MPLFADLLGTLRNVWKMGPKGSQLTLSASALTAPRTVSFPDKGGTLAMLDDVGGGGGGGPVFVKSPVTIDQVNNTVTPVDLQGQVFTVPPLKTLVLDGILIATAAATTTGIFYGYRVAQPAGSGGAALVSWRASVPVTSAAAATALEDGDVAVVNPGATSSAGVLSAASVAGNQCCTIKLIVHNVNTTLSTTVALQFRSEVAGSAVTAKQGSGAVGIIG